MFTLSQPILRDMLHFTGSKTISSMVSYFNFDSYLLILDDMAVNVRKLVDIAIVPQARYPCSGL